MFSPEQTKMFVRPAHTTIRQETCFFGVGHSDTVLFKNSRGLLLQVPKELFCGKSGGVAKGEFCDTPRCVLKFD